jgi:4-amino-4-deoxychorismate lyase
MVNGEIGNQVVATDRGLAYGDGLFETIRVARGNPVLLEFHLQRLVAGLQRLHIGVALTTVQQHVLRLLGLAGERHLGDGLIKLIVTRGDAGRGFSPDPDADATIVCGWFTLPDYAAEVFIDGVELITCQTRLPHRPQLAGLKHLNCLDYVMASLELRERAGCEGLLLDQGGAMIEAITANLFLVSRGELLTPALNRCGVAGTMRRWINEVAAPGMGLAVIERDLSLGCLQECEELFICNSVRGVVPVSCVEGRHWRRGRVTAELQTRTMKLFDA